MRRIKKSLFGGLILALALSGPPGCATMAERYKHARQRNIRDIASAAGKDYEKEMARRVRTDFANALNACISSMLDPDLSPFEMIVAVDAAGSVDHVYLNKPAAAGECLRKAVLEGSFPRPPTGRPFHGHISMRLR